MCGDGKEAYRDSKTPHPQRCETCERPYCDGETTRFKYCPIADHFVLMWWDDKYVPYTQTSQDFLKVGCASHSDFNPQAERDKVLREKFIEIGNKLEPYFDENSLLYVGSVMTPAGQALRTVMESLRQQGKVEEQG